MRLRQVGRLWDATCPDVGPGAPLGDALRLVRRALSLSDLPVHDPMPDFLFLLQGKNTALADAKRLAERLRTRSAALQQADT